MTIQGLNVTVNIQRHTEGTDDEVGGATVTTTTVLRGVRARISGLKPTAEMRAQGIETSKLFNAHVVPATLDIRESDYLIPQAGPHKDDEFLITGVQEGSLHQNSPRSFLALRLRRTQRARSVQ